MPRINVSGSVLYNDMTPAGNVVVKLIEIDLLGGSNDLILTKSTDGYGKFSGRTTEWNDREGTGPFGVAIPDVFLLHFEVNTPAGTHKGPFVMTSNGSVPIILPFGPFKPVASANRELVQITYLSDGITDPAERFLYQFIESGSNGLVDLHLANSYRRIHRITGNQATLANLVSKLDLAASRSSTLAVDLIVCTHGGSRNRIFFKDSGERGTTGTAVKDAIVNGLSDSRRAKLRMLFSTACFGNSHTRSWIQAGFKVASGSEGIYADSQASMSPFMNAWSQEKTFEECIKKANDGDIGNVADNLAKEFYRVKNMPDAANEVNSNRLIRGNQLIRIYSSPE